MKKLYLLFLITLLSSCGKQFPVLEDLSAESFKLIDQENQEVIFPDFVKGKTVVMGFIFTNCPDICPLTTNNMRLIQERLNEEKIKNIEFVALSFDPETDTPEVLKKYAELRKLDLSNWSFLTGEKPVTDAVIRKAGVFAMPGDTSVTPSGEEIIFYVHTDRISLIDTEGRIRQNYLGSKATIEDIVADIKELAE